MSKKGEEILQELVEQIPEESCPFCSNLFPTVVHCWFLEAAKGIMADGDLMSDYARAKLEGCRNPAIVKLVMKYRAES